MFAGGKNVVFLEVFDDFFDRKTLNSLSFFNILFFTSFRYRGTATRVPRYLNDVKNKKLKNDKEINVFRPKKPPKTSRKTTFSPPANIQKTIEKTRNACAQTVEKPRANERPTKMTHEIANAN